ncbi:putative annexin B9-like isoform X1 [Apostichopus japonicus]|uniref:Annexin n=1 Tax=Stichopus japonicus TaxID=307972 RepID=A0A2G8JSI2_STIJA|nr:putative annexin B9-like isoform X1 [Apostichopus japonicus]
MQPTVVAATEFNADKDAEQLYEAFKGFGTNENIVTSIFAGRSLEQRQSIQEAYKSKYNKDLVQEIRSEVSGNYLMALEGLIEDPADFHAKHLQRIICGVLPGCKDIPVLEVLSPLSSVGNDVNQSLTSQKVESDTNFLVSLKAEDWTPENTTLMDFLLKNNPMALFAVINSYKTTTNTDLLEVVKTQPKEIYREGFKVLVEAAQDHWMYFAKQLYQSMKGIGTNDSKLIYIIVFRCESDLGNIADTFQQTFNCSLQSFIRDDTSGDYGNLLIALVGPEVAATN